MTDYLREPPHPPTRPGWHCELCDHPWPCIIARVMLGDQYGAHDRVGLAVYMGSMLGLAARELVCSPRELYERFIAWTR